MKMFSSYNVLLFQITPYQHEPSCDTADRRGIVYKKSAKDDQFAGESDATTNERRDSRLESTSWCWCGLCQIMNSQRECVCCWEIVKAYGTVMQYEKKCITLIQAFDDVCLNREVLETAMATKRMMVGKCPGDLNRGNSDFRKQAYSNFVHWLYKNSLGRNNRVVLPSCVVLQIRKNFPNPCDEAYVGFLDASDPYPS